MAYLDETGLARFWYDIKQWIASALSNLVHRTGHESISGRKLFVSHQTYDQQDGWNLASRVIVKSEDITRGVTPAEIKYVSFDYQDSTYDVANDQGDGNPRLASLEYCHYTNGAYVHKLLVANQSNLSDKTELRIGYDANGIKFADAPSTSSQRNNGTDIVTRDWIPNDTRVVHTTGNEEIAGIKTFTDEINCNKAGTFIRVKNPNLTKGTYPASHTNFYFPWCDKDGNRMGVFETIVRNQGETLTRIYAYKNEAGSEDASTLEVNYPVSGAPYAVCPSTPDPTPANLNSRFYNKTGATDILTRDWIPRDVRIVHTSGDENITGVKYFNSSVYVKHPNLVKGTNPSSTVYRQFNFIEDADNSTAPSRVGCIENLVTTEGITETSIRAYNYVANSTNYERIAIAYPKNGTPYTYAPTPSDVDDNSTKIATTAWAFPRICKYIYLNATDSVDLNDYKTPGVYQFINNNNATFLNVPEGINGTLFVIGASNHVVRQIWFRWGTNNSTDHRVFIRQYVSGASPEWSNWTRLFTDKDTIPVANGGTGSTTKNFVDLSNNQSVAGTKTFTSELRISKSGTFVRYYNASITKGTAPSSNTNMWFPMVDTDGGYLASIEHMTWTNKQVHLRFYLHTFVSGSGDAVTVELGTNTDRTDCYFRPTPTNTLSLGTGGNIWKEIYAQNTAIQTSDERLKQQIADFDPKLLDVWDSVDWCQFKYNDAVAKKGDSARIHGGVVAQRIKKLFEDKGLDASAYSFFCYDKWDASPVEYDENGKIKNPGSPAGDQYSIRYGEALCIEAAYQRRENARLKKRIADLEERLAALELKIS